MTAADQIVRSAKKVLAMEGRPHMTTFAPILMSFSFRVLRRRQGSQEVAEIVGERVKLKGEPHWPRTRGMTAVSI